MRTAGGNCCLLLVSEPLKPTFDSSLCPQLCMENISRGGVKKKRKIIASIGVLMESRAAGRQSD